MQLLKNYAMPYRLFEQILLILKTADTRVDDLCEAVWRELVGQALRDAQGGGMPADAIVGGRLREWVARFYPSEAAPLGEWTV
jgi:nuclear pore complex protein Nup155